MNKKADDLIKSFKERGVDPERITAMKAEITKGGSHDMPRNEKISGENGQTAPQKSSIYGYSDMALLQSASPVWSSDTAMRTLDELLKKDKKREEDGFPGKIRVGKIVKPGKSGKIVVVPTTTEDKLIHDPHFQYDEDGGEGGSGESEEGDIIGERPIEREGGGAGPGQSEGDDHEIESSAYDLGRTLTEQFELPNIKDKGRKRSLTKHTYDMTDRDKHGQHLDKKATLRKIVETNIHLGNLTDPDDIDTTAFLISPQDLVYRLLSREKDFESQAMVFFMRDYSGSMAGKRTELMVAQHVFIYSWLIYQYANLVETRFILHDTTAKEVPNFYTYYNSRVAGGTQIASGYRLIHDIIVNENIARDYNIYIFQGTDGDDWDTEGKLSISILKALLAYVNRIGITVVSSGTSEIEKYIKKSGLLEQAKELIRLDIINDQTDEKGLIEGIKRLISE